MRTHSGKKVEDGWLDHLPGSGGPAGEEIFTGIIHAMMMRRPLVIFTLIAFSLIFLTACNHSSPVTGEATASTRLTETATASPPPSQTPIPPSQTPIPLAALVNGEAITLDEFQAELSRFQEATPITGTNLASDANTIVLNELIDQTLLAQSAAKKGFTVDEAMLQSRIQTLETQLGSAKALEDWEVAHGYQADEFERALKRAVAAAWMRDQIITAVPGTAEQVHAFEILFPTKAEADEVYSQLESGADFFELAATYNPATKGDLGWFPRNYLGEQAIDDVLFTLQPEQYSQVVETDVGFHIFYLVERDPSHTLQPDARLALQAKAVLDWLSEQRKQGEIKILLPQG